MFPCPKCNKVHFGPTSYCNNLYNAKEVVSVKSGFTGSNVIMLDKFTEAWWRENEVKYQVPPGALQGMKLILFNGPPGSGKDTAGKSLKHLNNYATAAFARSLKEIAHKVLGFPADLPYDAFDSVKNKPMDSFNGFTPRAFYILVSEVMIKPNLGKTFFGKRMRFYLWELRKQGIERVGITDSGFIDETGLIVSEVGHENVMLIRIHAENRGKTFANDSRSYFSYEGINTQDVLNNVEGDVEIFTETIRHLAHDHFCVRGFTHNLSGE